jgi:hypothetical protein
MYTELDDFIRLEGYFVRAKWIWIDDSNIYFRRSRKLINGVVYRCIDVANIEQNEKARNKGTLTNLMLHLEEKGENIYVENVCNPLLDTFLLKRGFTKMNIIDNCYLKLKV